MTKMTIEVEVPAGRSVAEVEGAIKRHFDPDWVGDWWHKDDVHGQANNWDSDEPQVLTDDEAREVLRLVEKYHDASIGINWDVIDCYIRQVKQARPPAYCCICKGECDREDLELVDDGSGDLICYECMHPEGENI
jgi:hypothetical protein